MFQSNEKEDKLAEVFRAIEYTNDWHRRGLAPTAASIESIRKWLANVETIKRIIKDDTTADTFRTWATTIEVTLARAEALGFIVKT